MRREPTPEERQVRAQEAKEFFSHPMFRAMFEGVSDVLENKALSCPSTDKEMAADIIRCKQLLVALRREIERKAEDGDFAAFELQQLNKKPLLRVFQR